MSEITLQPYDGLAEALYEAARASSAEVYPWLPWCHPDYTLDEARSFVAEVADARAAGIRYEFAILSHTGRFLGGCGLNAIRREQGIANLAYWVRSSARGRGVAPAAVRLLVAWARQHTHLRRIEVLVPVGNDASARVAEKVGAVREGIEPKRVRLPSGPCDAIVFAIAL